jgi:Mn2+/Fe2+ NRAMP family transporter
VAPWQLFFQQSYVIDKRITPRFMSYERWDLIVGIGFVMFGAFQDAGAVAAGIANYVGALPAALFALALFDASIIGAAAVSLSTAYAIGDVLSYRHSLHRNVADAPQFYVIYAGVIAVG